MLALLWIIAAPDWIAVSDRYTQMLLDTQLKHSPESASQQGLVAFDKEISIPTVAEEDALRIEEQAVLAQFKAAKESNPLVQQDLHIVLDAMALANAANDFDRAHDLDYYNASKYVFAGLFTLLQDQVAAERRPAAVVRIRKYAGLEKSFTATTEILKQRTLAQMKKPGVLWPSKAEIETELSRNANYWEGIPKLLEKYGLKDWQAPWATLKQQLVDYDAWVRATLLPKARTDFRLMPEEYALSLRSRGIDIAPDALAKHAHEVFSDLQKEMQALAARIAKKRKLPNVDYRAVLQALKQEQIPADKVLPLYKERLASIEKIIREKNLVTLPERAAIVRLASDAETAQQPAPHMQPPPFLNNTGQRGEFILPTGIKSDKGAKAYDDFSYDAATWTLTAHEARPGHELQFDSMLERGVSKARALYAFNSTNVEGWGLYSEWLVLPFMPEEGQLVSLNMRLLRVARAFLDPDLQAGRMTVEQARHVLHDDCAQSEAMTDEEIERYTFNAPGQAPSYFYGYEKMRGLRSDTETRLGTAFDAKKFHDFVLAQGLLPPALLREAVLKGLSK